MNWTGGDRKKGAFYLNQIRFYRNNNNTRQQVEYNQNKKAKSIYSFELIKQVDSFQMLNEADQCKQGNFEDTSVASNVDIQRHI